MYFWLCMMNVIIALLIKDPIGVSIWIVTMIKMISVVEIEEILGKEFDTPEDLIKELKRLKKKDDMC